MSLTSTGKPARRPGRPAQTGESAADLKQTILLGAIELFSRHGPDATTIQQVAEAVGVDRRLVYHYFQSKDKLYLQVLENNYSRLTVLANEQVRAAATLEEFLAALCRTYFQFCAGHPSFVRMMMWENLRHARGLRAITAASAVLKDARTKLRLLIHQAADQGRCRPDLEPELVILSCIGLCFYYVSNAATAGLVLDLHLEDPSLRKRWQEHIIRTAIHGVRPDSLPAHPAGLQR